MSLKSLLTLSALNVAFLAIPLLGCSVSPDRKGQETSIDRPSPPEAREKPPEVKPPLNSEEQRILSQLQEDLGKAPTSPINTSGSNGSTGRTAQATLPPLTEDELYMCRLMISAANDLSRTGGPYRFESDRDKALGNLETYQQQVCYATPQRRAQMVLATQREVESFLREVAPSLRGGP